MLPLWIRKNSDRHIAFKATVEKCGVDEDTVGLVLTECFKGFQEAFDKPSMPEIHMGLITFIPSDFKLRLRMLRYGTWLRNGFINKLFYIFLMLPLKLRNKMLLGWDKRTLLDRKNESLFMHNHYDRIMHEWQSDIKKYAENNNITMDTLGNTDVFRESEEDIREYKKKIFKRGNFKKQWKRERKKKLITN